MENKISRLLNRKNLIVLGLLGIVFLVIIYQLFFLSWLRSPLRLPSPMVSFGSSEEDYKILKPKYWPASEFKNGTNDDPYVISIIDAASHAGPEVRITRRRFESGNIEDVTSWGLTRAKSCNGFTFKDGSLQSYTSPNLAGMQYTYSCDWNTSYLSTNWVPSRCTDYAFYDQTFAYILSFCAREEHWSEVEPTFKLMADSFTLTGTQ